MREEKKEVRAVKSAAKYSKPELVKCIPEKIQTYSYPGQYVSAAALNNKIFSDLSLASKTQCQFTGKRTDNVVVFDPNTQQISFGR